MSGWLNHDDVLAQLQGIGLIVEGTLELARNNTSRRCRVEGMGSEKKGWYRLSEWVADEGVFLVGTYGIFQGADAGTRKVELSKRCDTCGREMPLKAKACSCGAKSFKSREMSPEQKAALKARMAEDKKQADAECRKRVERASRWATAVWRASQECTPADHDYFARKHLDQTCGARLYPGNQGVELEGCQDDDYRYLGQFAGALVIPLCDTDGKVFGVQFILHREKHRALIQRMETDKVFWPRGMSAEGKLFLLGGTPHGVGLIAEGYATAVSLHLATGSSVAVAYNAGNLAPVATALRRRYRRVRFLIGADDDWLQKCAACGKPTPVSGPTCAHCGQVHGKMNAGVTRASEAALAVSECAWVIPAFSAPRSTERKGPTDFNDLHAIESLNAVRVQIEAKLAALGWADSAPTLARGFPPEGGGEVGGERRAAVSIMHLDEVVERFIYVDDDTGEFCFDTWTKAIVKVTKVVKLLPARVRFDDVKDHPVWRKRAVYIDQIGFDPGGEDKNIVCNRWAGWPTVAKAGSCERQLELLQYLCGNEPNGPEIFRWILCWLAWPLQHPGAKMYSALVIHGPQGTGKSMVFEAYSKIYGEYSIVLNQGAIEDKFNSDWSDRKLFILADEIVARAEMHHLKNQLKTLITGEWVRVNPKNVAAHRERNHMNIVFASNEDQPVVLENDDRRHLVLWTPPKLGEDFYDEVAAEIENGGIAALHHYLLHLDTGDFRPWRHPPMTQAKRDLIDVSADSIERFLKDWQNGDIEGIPFCPCGSSDLYTVYLRWCRENGEKFPRTSAQFGSRIGKKQGWFKGHKDRLLSLHVTDTVRQRFIIPGSEALNEAVKFGGRDYRQREGHTIKDWLTACFFEFQQAMGGGE